MERWVGSRGCRVGQQVSVLGWSEFGVGQARGKDGAGGVLNRRARVRPAREGQPK